MVVVMVYGRIWLLGLYFELFPHNKNNNCYQALTCAGAAGKKGKVVMFTYMNNLILYL